MKKSLRAGALTALAIILLTGAFTAQAQRDPDRAANRRARILDLPQVRNRQGRIRPNRRDGAQPLAGRREQIQRQLMQALGLSPDQRQKMAEIRQNNEEAIIEAGRRFRQARQALDRAIRDENYNERIINQHIEEFASAQADLVRNQARVRAQLRSVLTSEQMTRLNRLEREYRQRIRQQRENEQKDGPQGALTPFDMPPSQAEETDLVGLLVFGK